MPERECPRPDPTLREGQKPLQPPPRDWVKPLSVMHHQRACLPEIGVINTPLPLHPPHKPHRTRQGATGRPAVDIRRAAAGVRGVAAMIERDGVQRRNLSEVMTAWMGSRGHRRNILNRKAEAVGLVQTPDNIWVMVLAAPC